MPTVRTTLQPDIDLDVSDGEVPVLRHQGLLLEDAAPPLARATTSSAAAPAAASTTTAKEA